MGMDLVRYTGEPKLPLDLSADDRTVMERVRHATMTSDERLMALTAAIRHVVRHKIAGSIVECGVWKGGSSMAAALTLLQEKDTTRDLYLYDTFEGMPPPTDDDRSADGASAQSQLESDEKGTGIWCYSPLEEVKTNMAVTGYPAQQVHLIKGTVEQTIPGQMPKAPIALLRLDTDWYESTKHELLHLFPLLSPGGILIIDDYGHWDGARKAVDEFLAAQPVPYFLNRIDYTGRLLVKHP